MEHSHGLHLLLLVFKHLGLKIDKTNYCLSRDIKNNYDNVDTFDPESENKPFAPTPPKNDPNSPKTAGAETRNINSIANSIGNYFKGQF